MNRSGHGDSRVLVLISKLLVLEELIPLGRTC